MSGSLAVMRSGVQEICRSLEVWMSEGLEVKWSGGLVV